jgi:site-specific DNA-methyltransferase (cytosine-N4-specific)
LRSYQDGGEHYGGQIGSEDTPEQFLEALWTVTDQCARVLKPSGSMFINLGDKYDGRKSLMGLPWRYALGCIDGRAGDPLILRAEIIWHKLNGLPESVTDRVRRNHEQWFHLTKEPRYFAAVDEIREPHKGGGVGKTVKERRADPEMAKAMHRNLAARNGGGGSFVTFAGNPLGKLPGSVWSMALEPLRVPDWLGVDHFAAFPTEWPRKLISGWCPEGGLVLDPFGGTGTVAMVARALGREALHVDLSTDYLKLAKWRVFESGQWAKAVRRTNEDNQQTLDL